MAIERHIFHQIRDTWKRDHQAAYSMYDNLLEQHPADPMLLREYGKAVFSENDDLEKAIALLERSLDLDPKAMYSWMYLGVLYSFGYGKGYSGAIDTWRHIIALFPDQMPACREAYLRIGQSYRDPSVHMSVEEAIEALEQAVQLDPLCPESYRCLAQGRYEARDLSGARKALQQAIDLYGLRNSQFPNLQKCLQALDEQQPWKAQVSAIPRLFLIFQWPDEVLE